MQLGSTPSSRSPTSVSEPWTNDRWGSDGTVTGWVPVGAAVDGATSGVPALALAATEPLGAGTSALVRPVPDVPPQPARRPAVRRPAVSRPAASTANDETRRVPIPDGTLLQP